MEALRPNNSVLNFTLNRRIDSEPYLLPRIRLSGLRFDQPHKEESQQTEVNPTETSKEGLNQFLDSQNMRVEFQKNKTTGEVVARIIQNQSGQVVREISVISFFRFMGGLNKTV
jgi:uncharacterized FlaG/YvyC family protein